MRATRKCPAQSAGQPLGAIRVKTDFSEGLDQSTSVDSPGAIVSTAKSHSATEIAKFQTQHHEELDDEAEAQVIAAMIQNEDVESICDSEEDVKVQDDCLQEEIVCAFIQDQEAKKPLVARAKGQDMSEQERMEQHFESANEGFKAFACRCAYAAAMGMPSCLGNFTRKQFFGWHFETYGVEQGRGRIPSSTSSSSKGATSEELVKSRPRTVSLSTVTRSLHQQMWHLRVPLEKMDAWGRKFHVEEWKLDGVQVCRKGWMQARGGSARRHRDIYGLVCRGHSPSDADASKGAKKTAALLVLVKDVKGRKDNEKRGFAANWWKNLFLLMDYMPNEERIIIRGGSDEQYYKTAYAPAAKRCVRALQHALRW